MDKEQKYSLRISQLVDCKRFFLTISFKIIDENFNCLLKLVTRRKQGDDYYMGEAIPAQEY